MIGWLWAQAEAHVIDHRRRLLVRQGVTVLAGALEGRAPLPNRPQRHAAQGGVMQLLPGRANEGAEQSVPPEGPRRLVRERGGDGQRDRQPQPPQNGPGDVAEVHVRVVEGDQDGPPGERGSAHDCGVDLGQRDHVVAPGEVLHLLGEHGGRRADEPRVQRRSVLRIRDPMIRQDPQGVAPVGTGARLGTRRGGHGIRLTPMPGQRAPGSRTSGRSRAAPRDQGTDRPASTDPAWSAG